MVFVADARSFRDKRRDRPPILNFVFGGGQKNAELRSSASLNTRASGICDRLNGVLSRSGASAGARRAVFLAGFRAVLVPFFGGAFTSFSDF